VTKAKVYLVSVQDPNLRYEVVRYNPVTNAATLQGRYGPFEVKPFNKTKIQKDGYRLVKEQEMEQHA
jgi:hypothetical protein